MMLRTAEMLSILNEQLEHLVVYLVVETKIFMRQSADSHAFNRYHELLMECEIMS